MKRFFLILFCLHLLLNGYSQQRSYPFYELYQLDSIGQSNSIAHHFGSIYYKFLLLVEKELEKEDTTTIRLIRSFEKVFALYYINACIDYANHQTITDKSWRNYFSDSTLQPLQYNLLGANAHLNSGISTAINRSYTLQEWQLIRKKYKLFNHCLSVTMDNAYQQAINDSKKARTIASLSFGFDKPLSRFYVHKWKERQLRLSEYFFLNATAYNKLLKKVNRKKEKIDRMVMNHL